MIIQAPFNPEHALPAAVRKALKDSGSRILRSGCYAAEEIKEATGWYYVDVTQEEIRVKRTKDSPLESMPTPTVIAEMIPAHDDGKALRHFTALIDTDHLTRVPTMEPKRGRHDVAPDGTPHARKPRGKRGKYNFSRRGYTRPVEKEAA